MVCNELNELCAKFGDLSPHKRINIMCGMLRMCLPPELRFIGSVVEDLAKKEYHFLREHELKANNPAELMKYNTSDEWTLQNAMALHLSLLHSWNTNCANTIFNILENKMKPSSQITNLDSMEKKLLILAMAMNHPAFTFHQRKTIYDYYQRVDHQLKSLLSKPPEATEQLSAPHSRVPLGSQQHQQQQQQQLSSSRTLVKEHKSQEEKDQKKNGPVSSASQITCSVSNRTSRVSPSQSPQLMNNVSTDSRSSSPTEQELSNILTRLNINKHQCLEKIPPEQLSCISMEELVKLGLSKEEAARVRSELDHTQREKAVNMPNGVIDPPVTQICYAPHGPHSTYLTMHPHGTQPAMYPTLYMYPPPFNSPGLMSNRVNSPTGSDLSSPSPSPLPNTKQINKGSDSSSDDNDKDKHSPAGSPMVEVKNNPVNKVITVDGSVRQTEEGKQATPSTTGLEIQGGSVMVGTGYQSDPSPTPSGYVHVINVPRHYKAQPAHTNMNIPPKNVISMPPDSQIIGKRSAALIPVGLAPPIPRSDVNIMTTSIMTSTTMTSVSGTHEYGKRLLMGPPTLRTSTMNGGHRPFACNVTNATTLTMATPLSSSAIGPGNITVSQATSGIKAHMSSENTASNVQQQQEMPSALPAPTHIASPVPVTHSSGSNYVQHASNSHTTCSSCGCPGHSEMSATYPYLHHILPSHVLHGQHMWHMPVPMTPTSNGIIPTPTHIFPPGYAYHIPNLTPNGLTHPEFMLGNHHPNFVHSAIPTPYSIPSGNMIGPTNGSHHALQRSNSINNERREKPRKLTCHNCGSAEHSASECHESSMEHISGHFHLSYEPTSD